MVVFPSRNPSQQQQHVENPQAPNLPQHIHRHRNPNPWEPALHSETPLLQSVNSAVRHRRPRRRYLGSFQIRLRTLPLLPILPLLLLHHLILFLQPTISSTKTPNTNPRKMMRIVLPLLLHSQKPSILGDKIPIPINIINISITLPLPKGITKESLLGNRLFAKCIDPTLSSLLANTSSPPSTRTAISRLGSAWQDLDREDPEGGFLFLKQLIEKIGGDAKLAGALLPSSSQVSGQQVAGTGTGTGAVAPLSRSSSQVSNGAGGGGGGGAKLMLAQNNPHLKSHHRRRQSAILSPVSNGSSSFSTSISNNGSLENDDGKGRKGSGSKNGFDNDDNNNHGDGDGSCWALEKKFPGGMGSARARGGAMLDHEHQFAEALYGQWVRGLGVRWPGVGGMI